ncbi:hypothetical protein HAX54_014502 [Datura stramonium]|uniref:Uncharacterized protein n=1 Tax=Datura stramonium TaxID=4076 RepID=A0ABS8S0S7_DATST|nr:hypothetical protein [Datura stramonium]
MSDETPSESLEIIIHEEANQTQHNPSHQAQKIPSSIPFKISDFVAWNIFKNQFSTFSDVPSFQSHLSILMCDVVPFQSAKNESIPIMDLISKRFCSRLGRKSGSSILILEEEPTSEQLSSIVLSRVPHTRTRKRQEDTIMESSQKEKKEEILHCLFFSKGDLIKGRPITLQGSKIKNGSESEAMDEDISVHIHIRGMILGKWKAPLAILNNIS